MLCLILVTPDIYSFSNQKSIGKVSVKKNDVYIEHDGKTAKVSSFGGVFYEGDIVKTGPEGKAELTLQNGDVIVMAPDTRMDVDSDEKLPPEIESSSRVDGKIRAQIRKTDGRKIRFKTANALVGVKGTDFVIEFKNKATTVATVKGLVNMQSSVTENSVDIPAGRMSSVSAAGDVLPLREIAGDIMSDVEIAGKKMEESDVSGQKISM